MKKFKENLRWFLLGMVPSLCIFCLILGICTAWIQIRFQLEPQENEPDFSMAAPVFPKEPPDFPGKYLAEKYPVLIPRRIRLAAWGLEILKNRAGEYISEKIPPGSSSGGIFL